MGDIFQEVDDEVRQALLLRLWKRYGRYLILGLVGIVLTTVGKVSWDELQIRKIAAESTRFSSALKLAESGQYEEAALSFGLIADESGTGYAQLAALRKAAALVEFGQVTEALSVYDELAITANPILSDLVVIQAAMLRLNQGLVDDAISAINPVAESTGPWVYLAKEIKALAMLQDNNMEGAKQLLVSLADDPTAPASIASRAQKLLAANHGNLY